MTLLSPVRRTGSRLALFLGVAALLLLPAPSRAQAVKGTLLGTVTDSQGGGVQQSPSVTFGGSPGDPTVHLDLDLRVGEIDVRQR